MGVGDTRNFSEGRRCTGEETEINKNARRMGDNMKELV